MRSIVAVVLILAVASFLTSPALAQTYFQAHLDGAQVVSPTTSGATGMGCFVLNPDNTLDYQVSYSGLMGVETGAHIHGPAPAGVNAGVQFALPPGSPKAGTLGPLTAAQVTDLSSGLYYVQIHSDLFPGGEIRGQILTSADACALATEETTWGAVKQLYH